MIAQRKWVPLTPLCVSNGGQAPPRATKRNGISRVQALRGRAPRPPHPLRPQPRGLGGRVRLPMHLEHNEGEGEVVVLADRLEEPADGQWCTTPPRKILAGNPGECWLAEKGARTKGRPKLHSPTTGLV